jgi:hypothetical protein
MSKFKVKRFFTFLLAVTLLISATPTMSFASNQNTISTRAMEEVLFDDVRDFATAGTFTRTFAVKSSVDHLTVYIDGRGTKSTYYSIQLQQQTSSGWTTLRSTTMYGTSNLTWPLFINTSNGTYFRLVIQGSNSLSSGWQVGTKVVAYTE